MLKRLTPCIGICTATALGDKYCTGCKRHERWVRNWNTYPDSRKLRIMRYLENIKMMYNYVDIKIDSNFEKVFYDTLNKYKHKYNQTPILIYVSNALPMLNWILTGEPATPEELKKGLREDYAHFGNIYSVPIISSYHLLSERQVYNFPDSGSMLRVVYSEAMAQDIQGSCYIPMDKQVSRSAKVTGSGSKHEVLHHAV